MCQLQHNGYAQQTQRRCLYFHQPRNLWHSHLKFPWTQILTMPRSPLPSTTSPSLQLPHRLMWSLSSQLPEPYLFTPCGIHHFLSCINYACAWPIYILLTFLKHKDILALFHLCHPPPPVPEAVTARGPAGSHHAEPVWGTFLLAHYRRKCLVFHSSKQSCSRHKARQKGKAKLSATMQMLCCHAVQYGSHM